MIKLKIKDILGISGARLVLGDENYVFHGFSKDTRTIQKKDTYVAIKGDIFDGNLFYKDAFLNGADTCVLEYIDLTEDVKKEFASKNIILVDDTVEFLAGVAKWKRNYIKAPVIAITGSVGKTSTKVIVADTLSSNYSVLTSIRNENTKIGMSLRLLNYQNEEMVVLEMGMNHAGEIRELTNIAQPDVAIITNVGTSHIGNLGSRENILKAKLEILEGLSGPVIVNNDNDLLHEWVLKHEYDQIITFGIHENSDYQAMNVHYDKDGSSYELKEDLVKIPVIGDAFIYNSLVAFVIGDLYHVKQDDIKKVLSNLKTEPHRMEFINDNGYTIIDDTYNASYDSVAYSLDVLKRLNGRKIAVLGDIFELGDYGEEIHKKIGALVAKQSIDMLVTVGMLACFINEEALKNGFLKDRSFHFSTNEEAISFLKKILQDGDLVLVKASHGMNFGESVSGIQSAN